MALEAFFRYGSLGGLPSPQAERSCFRKSPTGSVTEIGARNAAAVPWRRRRRNAGTRKGPFAPV